MPKSSKAKTKTSRKRKVQTKPKTPGTRANSKQAQLIEMLQRPDGATIDEIVKKFDWQAHTVRGAIAGALKKKLGLNVQSEKVEGPSGQTRRRFVVQGDNRSSFTASKPRPSLASDAAFPAWRCQRSIVTSQ
jgi:hypothetical protein